MALSTCLHCQNHFFELTEVSPIGSNYRLFFVQCAKCGVPTGVTEYYDAGSLVKAQEKKIEAIEAKLGRLEQMIHAMGNALNMIAQRLS